MNLRRRDISHGSGPAQIYVRTAARSSRLRRVVRALVALLACAAIAVAIWLWVLA